MIKPLEAIGVNLHDLGICIGVLEIATKKIVQLGFIKIEYFCASEGTIKKVKRQPVEQERIFAVCVSDERPAARMCEGL